MYMYYIMAIYLAGMLYVIFAMLISLLLRFDAYDWKYSMNETAKTFALVMILWPVLILKPLNLINPGRLLSSSSEADYVRFWKNLPPCGPQLYYRLSACDKRVGQSSGEFIFCSSDVEECLLSTFRQNPHLNTGLESDMLHWLQHRDKSIVIPVAIPDEWDRFKYIANELLRTKSMEVRCLKCNDKYRSDELQRMDDENLPGWNFNRLLCPNGHLVLGVLTHHNLMTTRHGIEG
jgi:hypothetical protein